MLSIHLHLVPRLRMSGDIPPPCLWTGTALALLLYTYEINILLWSITRILCVLCTLLNIPTRMRIIYCLIFLELAKMDLHLTR